MTGFKLTGFAKGACLYSGRLELFSFTLTDLATGETVSFADIPFPTNSSARDILAFFNECYEGADSHLDPELGYYLPLVTNPVVGTNPFSYDKSLKPFDDIQLTCDTPPRVRELQTGKRVSLHEIPDMQIAVEVMRTRLRFLRGHTKGEGDCADCKIVEQSPRRDEAILLCLNDVYQQHRFPASVLFKRFDLTMLLPHALDLVRRVKRVALVLSYGNDLDPADACLWVKDNDPGIPSKATTIDAISRREDYTQPLRLMRERLSHRGSKDYQPVWDAAKRGDLIVLCLKDLHTKFWDDPKLGHVSNVTPFHLKPAARELLAVAKRVLFVNSLTGEHGDCQCVYWKGEPEAA